MLHRIAYAFIFHETRARFVRLFVRVPADCATEAARKRNSVLSEGESVCGIPKRKSSGTDEDEKE